MILNYRSVRSALSGCAILLAAAVPATAAPSPVQWTAVTKAAVSGGTIAKTSGCSGCADAGGVSVQQFTSGTASFLVTPGFSLDAGLGQNASGSLGYRINYAFRFSGGSSWEIREAGIYRLDGTFAATDLFSVSVDAGVVKYYRNGAVIYTSRIAAAGSLVVDVALVTTGAAVTATTDVVGTVTAPIAPTTSTSAMTWTSVVNATASGSALQKSAGCDGCPDAGAVGDQQFTAGSISFTTTGGHLVAGLGRNTQPAYEVDYAFSLGWGVWEIRERGTYRADGAYAATDVFKIVSDGVGVRYYRNATLVYTSKTPVQSPMRATATLVSSGVKIQATTQGVATATPPPPPPPPAPAPSGTNLRLLQWNVHHGGYGTDGVYSTERIASWIVRMSPDVVTLNEIEKYTSWGNEDQPEVYKNLLQAKTGKTWYYHFAQEWGQWSSNGKGNLILSTYPITFSNRYELMRNYDRSIAEVEVTVNGRNISLILTHLDPYDATLRLTQAIEVTTWSAVQPENRIITGDMNAWPDQASIAKYNESYYDSWTVALGKGAATTFSGNNGETKNGRIDYIFYSKGSANLTVKSSQVYDTRDSNGVMPSDHRPVLTHFIVQ